MEHTTLTLPDGTTVKFPLEGFARYCLLNGVDELGYLLSQNAAISTYEQTPPMKATSESKNRRHRGRRHRSRSRRRRRTRAGARRAEVRPRVHAAGRAVRRRGHRPHGRSAAPGHARRVPRGRCRVARRHRRTEVGSVSRRCVPSRDCCACAASSACTPTCGPIAAASGAARCLGAQAGGARRRGPDLRARAHRRHLLRRKEARRHQRQRPVHLLGAGDRAHHARRRPAGHAAPQEDRFHRQVQRARNFAPVARSQRTRDQARVSRT